MDEIPVPLFQGFVCSIAFLERLSNLMVSTTSVLGIDPTVQPILFQFLHGTLLGYTNLRYYDTNNTRRALRGDFRIYGDQDRDAPNTQGWVGYKSLGNISITVRNFQLGVETLLSRLISDAHIAVETEGDQPTAQVTVLTTRNLLFRQQDLIYRVPAQFQWYGDNGGMLIRG